MDSRDLACLMIGIMLGAGIGYIGSNMMKPIVESYSFATTLSLTSTSSSMLVGQTITFKVGINITLPSELQAIPNINMINQYLLQDKQVSLLVKGATQELWGTFGTKTTTYLLEEGTTQFVYTTNINDTYQIKAVFSGTNLLKASESSILTLTVTP